MTEDRRQFDRRQQDTPVPLERRHGERRTYLHGCRCRACRAANSAYWLRWFHAKQAGTPLLGTRISAAQTHILMKQIRCEDISNHQLGRDLFGGYRAYKRIRRAGRITLRTALKVRRFFRLRVADDQLSLIHSGPGDAS
jgi:hypothetical protein